MGEGGEVIIGEPEGGFDEMGGNGGRMEEAEDGLSWEINRGDALFDDAENSAATDRDEDEVAGEERLVGGIGENAAASAKNFSGYYLEKHNAIIA